MITSSGTVLTACQWSACCWSVPGNAKQWCMITPSGTVLTSCLWSACCWSVPGNHDHMIRYSAAVMPVDQFQETWNCHTWSCHQNITGTMPVITVLLISSRKFETVVYMTMTSSLHPRHHTPRNLNQSRTTSAGNMLALCWRRHIDDRHQEVWFSDAPAHTSTYCLVFTMLFDDSRTPDMTIRSSVHHPLQCVL